MGRKRPQKALLGVEFLDTFSYGEAHTARSFPFSVFPRGASVPLHTTPPAPGSTVCSLCLSPTPLDFTWWNQAVSALPRLVDSTEHSVREAQPGCVCARASALPEAEPGPVCVRLRSLDTWAAPTADPEVGPLGHAAALVCGQEACISCGAGSAEQARRAPEPRRDAHHVCLRCGGQGERFQPLLKLLVVKTITQAGAQPVSP